MPPRVCGRVALRHHIWSEEVQTCPLAPQRVRHLSDYFSFAMFSASATYVVGRAEAGACGEGGGVPFFLGSGGVPRSRLQQKQQEEQRKKPELGYTCLTLVLPRRDKG